MQRNKKNRVFFSHKTKKQHSCRQETRMSLNAFTLQAARKHGSRSQNITFFIRNELRHPSGNGISPKHARPKISYVWSKRNCERSQQKLRPVASARRQVALGKRQVANPPRRVALTRARARVPFIICVRPARDS